MTCLWCDFLTIKCIRKISLIPISVIKIITRSKAFAVCWVSQLLINQKPILSRAPNKILAHSFLPKEIVSSLSWPNYNGQIVNSFSHSSFSHIRVQIGLLSTFFQLTSWLLIFTLFFFNIYKFPFCFFKGLFSLFCFEVF